LKALLARARGGGSQQTAINSLEGTDPNTIVQVHTNILPGRPTEMHDKDPEMRLLWHYERNRARL
jgi:hypothetical protein